MFKLTKAYLDYSFARNLLLSLAVPAALFPLFPYEMGSENSYDRGEITIFLAEDDSDDVLFFQQALEEINLPHKLHIACNGQHLIELLVVSDVTPDIIFLDINMPIKNGMETLIEVRKALIDPVPVVMLSTSASEAMIASSQMLGASGYVCKPSSYPKLRKILSGYWPTIGSAPAPVSSFLTSRIIRFFPSSRILKFPKPE